MKLLSEWARDAILAMEKATNRDDCARALVRVLMDVRDEALRHQRGENRLLQQWYNELVCACLSLGPMDSKVTAPEDVQRVTLANIKRAEDEIDRLRELRIPRGDR